LQKFFSSLNLIGDSKRIVIGIESDIDRIRREGVYIAQSPVITCGGVCETEARDYYEADEYLVFHVFSVWQDGPSSLLDGFILCEFRVLSLRKG